MSSVSESDVEDAALGWFEELGYAVLHVPDIGPDGSAGVRDEIATEFEPYVRSLQFHGDGYRDGQTFRTHGIVYVPDLYTTR